MAYVTNNDNSPTLDSHGRSAAQDDVVPFFAKRSSSLPLSNDPDPPSTNALMRLIRDCEAQVKRGSPVTFGTLTAVWDALKNQNGIGLDDRKFLLEEILVFMSRLPPGTQLGRQVEHFLIDLLYKDLPHPPATYLGPFVSSTSAASNVLGLKGFAYREADGRDNNPLIPDLGAAHRPYARSVASSHVAPSSTLPDPGVVFDMLLKRDKDVEHPTGLSSMFFAFANFIIHSLFRTNSRDWSVNDTSSYLDLSPLYGVDQKEQDGVRRFDGTGRLWDDVFADSRLLAMPPSVGALIVVFNRNHNFVATRILNINENRNFASDPLPQDKDKLKAQDDEIFNRARLVNCGAFMQVIMRDYVGTILRMIPDLTPWHLRPLDPIRDSKHEIAPRGEGNVCSVEFNLLYRWHATTSSRDEKWLENLWKNLFPNKAYDEVTPAEFFSTLGPALKPDPDVTKWTFGRLKRDERTNRFDDGDLADFLQNATSDAAHAFKARGTPAVFRVIEMIGIQQARTWGVCSLNEFRSFLGLRPYSSFKEWNPLPEIYGPAEQLYHDIDNMELYVGMQAEDTRPTRPGSGLCSGYTMSRSILADAIALIRGDRFLTIEYTPYNLTSWGFRDAETEDDNGSLGGMLTKLLFRALPRHYPPSSVHAHFPFIVPEHMREYMAKERGMAEMYDWEKPQALSAIIPVSGFEAVKEVVTNSTTFFTPYESPMTSLTEGYGFYLGASNSRNHGSDSAMIKRALFTPAAISQHIQFYYEKTLELIADKSYSPVGAMVKNVDIVREVINFVPVHWVATRVAGLPLKTKDNPDEGHSEQELYGYLAVLFAYIFLNNEPVNAWFLEQNSRKAAKVLLHDITQKLDQVSSHFSVRYMMDTLTSIVSGDAENQASEVVLRQLYETNRDRERKDLVYNVFGIIINSVANWAHAMTHVINFYLDVSRKKEKDVIVALAGRPTNQETESLLIGYVREALRLDPPVAGVLRQAHANIDVQGTQVSGGERVFADLATAVVDEKHLGSDASAVNPRRPHTESQLSFVVGAHSSLDEEFSDKTMAHVLRAVFSKKNLRRASGVSGQLTRFTEDVHGTRQKLYIDTKGQVTPWPQSLLVQYDI